MNTTTTRSAELHRIYSPDKLFDPCERSETRFWDTLQEADDVAPRGAGLYFHIVGAMDHAVGNPAEGGDWSDPAEPLDVECFVTAARTDSTLALSSTFLEAGKGDGSYSGDVEHDAILRATKGLFSYQNRLLVAGHATGRLAIVEASTVASTTFVCAGPECAFQLRRNQTVDFVDTDTGGTVQASGKISDIDPQTRTVTLTAAKTLTAGWGVYQTGVYGNPIPNGLRNIVDTADYRPTGLIFGVAPTGNNTFLNSVVVENTGAPVDYSEEMVRDAFDLVTFNQDSIPTLLLSNTGILGEHYRLTTKDRLFLQTDSVPSYNLGANHDKLSFTYGGVKIPMKYERDMPARELYGVHMPSLRKHTLRKADWFRGDNGDILQLIPAAGGGTWSYGFTAAMMMEMNLSARKLNCHFVIRNIKDRGAARDA